MKDKNRLIMADPTLATLEPINGSSQLSLMAADRNLSAGIVDHSSKCQFCFRLMLLDISFKCANLSGFSSEVRIIKREHACQCIGTFRAKKAVLFNLQPVLL